MREFTRWSAHTVEDRFWSKVDMSGDCWIWTAALHTGGYGAFRRTQDGRHWHERAHRVAWELTYGPIPDGLFVLHQCDNRPCVRPNHLFLGTKADNADDRDTKGRGRPGFDDPAVRARAQAKHRSIPKYCKWCDVKHPRVKHATHTESSLYGTISEMR